VTFAGELSAPVEEAVRRAHVARPPGELFTGAALGGLLLALGLLLPGLLVATRVALLVPGALLLLRAAALPSLWWLLLRSRLRAAFAGRIEGSIGPEGLRYGPVLAPWERPRSVKVHGPVALVFLDRLDALPLHRSWFRSEEDWRSALETLSARLPRGVPGPL
jgi:hypothetical protein